MPVATQWVEFIVSRVESVRTAFYFGITAFGSTQINQLKPIKFFQENRYQSQKNPVVLKRVFLARTDVFAFLQSHLKGAKPCKDSFTGLDCSMAMGLDTSLSIVEWNTTNYDTMLPV